MEAAAQNKIPVIVLDRPNPNAHYIDGPVLKDELHSFVGMHPVPIVYGMTIGEYAQMINGEKWLQGGITCDLTVIPIANYRHDKSYSLPVKPSPNLPNDLSVALYPSLCLFEGTPVSCGRGTDKPFQVFGAPGLPETEYPFSFIPKPNEGASHPKFNGEVCHGKDLHSVKPPLSGINLQWLLEAYKYYPEKKKFFNAYFDKLAGDRELKEQIILGYSEEDIKRLKKKLKETAKDVRNGRLRKFFTSAEYISQEKIYQFLKLQNEYFYEQFEKEKERATKFLNNEEELINAGWLSRKPQENKLLEWAEKAYPSVNPDKWDLEFEQKLFDERLKNEEN
jgi:uncharacterized protein YbbC (DUF1343 family)